MTDTTPEQEFYKYLKELEIKPCYKCNKKTTHQFMVNQKPENLTNTCIEHAKDFNPNDELYISVLTRYELLQMRRYPNSSYLDDEGVQKVIDNDFNLSRHHKQKIEYEDKQRIERMKEQYKSIEETRKEKKTPETFVESGKRKLVYKNHVIGDTVGFLRKVLQYHNGYDISNIEVKRLNPNDKNGVARFDIIFTMTNEDQRSYLDA